jgi:hypothetical protein
MSKIYVAEHSGYGAAAQGDTVATTPAPPIAEQVIDSAATTGNIGTLGAITAGTLYTNGTYSNVPLTGGTGSGATANITVSGGGVTAVTLVGRGTGYTAADALSAAAANIGGTGSGFSIPVSTIIRQSVAFQAKTAVVEISADGICSILIGTDPVPTISNTRLAANERKLVSIAPGQSFKVGVITNT